MFFIRICLPRLFFGASPLEGAVLDGKIHAKGKKTMKQQ
jgi:hypothetical protein